MVCPAASMWWDWLEKLGLVSWLGGLRGWTCDKLRSGIDLLLLESRQSPSRKGKILSRVVGRVPGVQHLISRYRGYYQDDTAITSIAVKNYTQALWTERCRAQVGVMEVPPREAALDAGGVC